MLKIRNNNLFFGLGDVLRIISLQIDGKPIIVKNVDGRVLCGEYIGTHSSVSEHISRISLV